MHRSTAIIFFARTPQISRGNPNEPYTTMPWDDLDAFFAACLGDLIENASRINDGDVHIHRNPAELSDDFFRLFGDRVKCFDMPDGSIAHQVQSAVDMAFTQQYKRVVVVLDNRPTISTKNLFDMLNHLGYEDDSIVVGSTVEGRCYILAMRTNHSDIFEHAADDPIMKPDLLLQRLCQRSAMIIPTQSGYFLDSGFHIARLKLELDRMDESCVDFPRRTHSMFKMFEKKYKPRKVTR
jgi:hypothetical protein